MIHNQLSHGAELQNGIASAVGLSRELEGVVRLGETLEPNIDPWSQPEWAFLRGERLGCARGAAVAVAAEFPYCCFGNAAGSGNIVVVEQITVQSGTAQSCRLEVAADTLVSGTLSAQAFFGSARDRRFGSTTGRSFFRTGTDPASTLGGVPTETIIINNTSYVPFVVSVPFILKPGDDLLIIGLTVNTTLDVNWKWRERKAFTGELPGQ